jgi:hypothetical protein
MCSLNLNIRGIVLIVIGGAMLANSLFGIAIPMPSPMVIFGALLVYLGVVALCGKGRC